MSSHEFISEIDYTPGIDGENAINPAELLQHGVLVGELDYRDVYLFDTAAEELYFIKTDEVIDAYVTIEKAESNGYYRLRGLQNLSKKSGYVTALVAFITHRLNKKLVIAADEQLSPAGFNWLKSIINAKGRGLTFTDQTGKFPDIESIESEWNHQMNDYGYGPTEIMIESRFGQGLRPRIFKTKANCNSMVRKSFFIGDSTIL